MSTGMCGGRRLRFMALALAIAGLAILSAAGCGSSGSAPGATTGQADPPTSVSARKAAPALTGATLDGLELSNEAFKGMPLVLAFWGSW
jgi:hypothetical protein